MVELRHVWRCELNWRQSAGVGVHSKLLFGSYPLDHRRVAAYRAVRIGYCLLIRGPDRATGRLSACVCMYG